MNTPAHAVLQSGSGILPLLRQPTAPDKRQDAASTTRRHSFFISNLKLKLAATLITLCAVGTVAPAQPTATPLLPSGVGTYYYEGFDPANNRYVFIAPVTTTTGTITDVVTGSNIIVTATSGAYFYVDTAGNTTTGGAGGAYPFDTPYRAVIVAPSGTSTTTGTVSGTITITDIYNRNSAGDIVAAGTANYQFYNVHADLFTPATGADSGATYAVRSGTWDLSNTTFTLTTGADAAIYASGYTNVTGTDGVATPWLHPVTLTGSNVNAIVEHVTASSRGALQLRNGASAFLYGGTLSKSVVSVVTSRTVTTSATTTITETVARDAGSSETIYLVANQEGLGSSSHLYGEDLTIIADGPTIAAFHMGNGHTTVELYRTTIISGSGGGPNSYVARLNDQQAQGGAHFYGEELTIDNHQGRTFAFGYGANTITLKNSTVTASGTKGAVFRWITSEGTGGGAGGNEAMHDGNTSSVTLENTSVTTTADYAPIFQQTGRFGKATVTGGTLTTTGMDSPIIRLVGANDAQDESRFTGIFTNVLIEAPNSSAIDLDILVRDSTNYGEDGGGVGKEVTTLISTAWDIVFQSSTLNAAKAMRIATAGVDNSPFANETKVTVRDSLFNGRIEMLVTGGGGSRSYETSGANLRFKGERSTFTGGFYLTGTEIARKYHQAELYLIDSFFGTEALPAPVIMENRGDLVLKFENTPMIGDFTLSGSTRTYLDLVRSPVTGAISLAGTALLENRPGLDLYNRAATVHDSSISGGFHLAGASSVDLSLTGNTIVSGGITATGAATATLRFGNGASINGGVTLSGSSSVTLVLSSVDQLTGNLVVNDRARFALATFAGTPISLDRDFDLGGIWSIPGKTTLVGALDLTSPLATLSIASAATDSLILKSGLTGNGRLDIESIDGALVGVADIHVIRDETNTFVSGTDRPLILSHPVDYGLAAYTLENRADGAHLVGGLDRGSFSTGGAAVINTTALSAQDWFAALEPLQRHASDLRDRAAISAFRASRFDAGNLWVQGRAVDTKVDRSTPSLDFTQRTLGITAGADACYDLDTSTLATGVFADTATTLRDFISTADARTVTIGAGFTALWSHRNGLYASALARFDTSNHTLDTHAPNNALSADYHTQSGGIALEAGWRLGHDFLSFIPEGWWFEPSLGFGYAKLAGATYTTESNRANNIIDITLAGAKAIQYRAALAVGYKLDENWNLLARLAYANVNASGGAVSGGGVRNVATLLDGARCEAAVGVTRRIGSNGRIHLDYAYTVGDDYTRPYTLTLGYSHTW
jgi:outer membrane autotransporter protein